MRKGGRGRGRERERGNKLSILVHNPIPILNREFFFLYLMRQATSGTITHSNSSIATPPAADDTAIISEYCGGVVMSWLSVMIMVLDVASTDTDALYRETRQL